MHTGSDDLLGQRYPFVLQYLKIENAILPDKDITFDDETKLGSAMK